MKIFLSVLFEVVNTLITLFILGVLYLVILVIAFHLQND